jgi:integrase
VAHVARTCGFAEIHGFAVEEIIDKMVHMTGARIHEVRSMKIMDNTIALKGKGGKRRVLDFSYRLEALAEIRDLMARLTELSKGVDWQHYCQQKDSLYQAHVKAVCRSLKDEYAGAHGFRATYAQELRKRLKDRGLTKEEIELIITRELGHERKSMARHYLSV